MWECGLKLSNASVCRSETIVTPYVGVWIETHCSLSRKHPRYVTPYVGVWIETVWQL